LKDFFLIAKIQSTYDSDGSLMLLSYSDFPDRFFELDSVFVDLYGEKKELFVENVKNVKDKLIIKFKNFNSDKEVEILVGKRIYVEASKGIILSESMFFVHDLIGSKVYKNTKFFGRVIDVINLPANDVYVIEDINRKEILVPAVKDYIEEFDPSEKKMILRSEADLDYDD
jgi:16S rRNA processing protein RimM